MSEGRPERNGVRSAAPIFFGAIVLGGAIGVAFAYARKPNAPTSPPSSTPHSATTSIDAKTSEPTTKDASIVASDAPPRPKGDGSSWIDFFDAAQPPPESQLDPDYLINLVTIANRDEANVQLAKSVLGGRRHRANQGNFHIATHRVSKAQCLEGLRNVEIQSPLQRLICDHPNEVPIHKGDPLSATTCIDVFEYPNVPCELPFVHLYGMQAEQLCALDGKRLCTDDEWDTACEADPSGGPNWQYAYGNDLDLSVCDTGKPWPPTDGPVCKINTDLWNTCATNTEPAGAFPRCRSRLGVFDQHGNVAELMHRWENGVDYIQMKGSAFFYDGKMYRDHCRYDPRWHVDEFKHSWHDNYHLGFRCCRSIKSMKQRMAEDAGANFSALVDAGATSAAKLPKAPENEYEEEIQDATTAPPKPSASTDDDPYGSP